MSNMVAELIKPRISPLPRRLPPELLQQAWDNEHLDMVGNVLVPKIGGGTVPGVENLATLAETTTTADPGTAGVSLAVTSRSAPFPQTGQFRILVQNTETDKTNREIMTVTGGLGAGAGSFTVTRGQEGTTGVAHPVGSYVAQVLTKSGILATVPRVPNPADHAMLAWTGDPIVSFADTAVDLVSGTIQLCKVMLLFPMTISTINYAVTSIGATLTSAQNFVGIYDSAGTRQGLSADQSTLWTTLGVKNTALAAAWTPATTGPDAFCWVAFLSVGTTPPKFSVLSHGTIATTMALANIGLTTANMRFGTNATAQTSLPASITVASNVNNAICIWVALS